MVAVISLAEANCGGQERNGTGNSKGEHWCDETVEQITKIHNKLLDAHRDRYSSTTSAMIFHCLRSDPISAPGSGACDKDWLSSVKFCKGGLSNEQQVSQPQSGFERPRRAVGTGVFRNACSITSAATSQCQQGQILSVVPAPSLIHLPLFFLLHDIAALTENVPA